jgi:hypothetical protein
MHGRGPGESAGGSRHVVGVETHGGGSKWLTGVLQCMAGGQQVCTIRKSIKKYMKFKKKNTPRAVTIFPLSFTLLYLFHL